MENTHEIYRRPEILYFSNSLIRYKSIFVEYILRFAHGTKIIRLSSFTYICLIITLNVILQKQPLSPRSSTTLCIKTFQHARQQDVGGKQLANDMFYLPLASKLSTPIWFVLHNRDEELQSPWHWIISFMTSSMHTVFFLRSCVFLHVALDYCE